MNALRTIFLVAAVAAAVAVAPVALAGSPSPAELRALEIRGEALTQACLDPTSSRAAFRSLCTYADVQNQPNPAELRALEIRGEALTQACLDPAGSREAFRAWCTYSPAQSQPIPADVSSSGGFDWREFGLGAGAMLVLALLLGGTAVAVLSGRRDSVEPRTAS
ncbi:MAG TPA: hypothetical protein VFU99_03195 [Gaiellaceae bacterium]|nr:hypothetical protein [Gaiellaceae bacterium]